MTRRRLRAASGASLLQRLAVRRQRQVSDWRAPCSGWRRCRTGSGCPCCGRIQARRAPRQRAGRSTLGGSLPWPASIEWLRWRSIAGTRRAVVAVLTRDGKASPGSAAGAGRCSNGRSARDSPRWIRQPGRMDRGRAPRGSPRGGIGRRLAADRGLRHRRDLADGCARRLDRGRGRRGAAGDRRGDPRRQRAAGPLRACPPAFPRWRAGSMGW